MQVSRMAQRGDGAASAGSVSAQTFKDAFEAVRIHTKVSSQKDFISECQKQGAILENDAAEWSQKVKALQSLRSLLMQGAADNAEFVSQCFSLLGVALLLSVKSLRSQVCREACVTVGYFCEKMGANFWKVAEQILPISLNLMQNCAKVMASSGVNANHYIAKFVHHPRILPPILQAFGSKSKEIRKEVINLIADIISEWEAPLLERHWEEISQTIKSGVYDADSEVRSNARRAFELLQNQYPTIAESLYMELDPNKQRMLAGRSSTASSTQSIHSERDTLPGSQRGGLYNAQQSTFLSKRSASDLNHAVRKLNLMRPAAVRPNVIKTPRPILSATPGPQPLPKPSATPTSKKPFAPNVVSAKRPVEHAPISKTSSQPGSRSTSPGRTKATKPSPVPNIVGRVNGRDMQSGLQVSQGNGPIQGGTPSPFALNRALRNVDMSRYTRPNVVKSVFDGKQKELNGGVNGGNTDCEFYGLSKRQEAVLREINPGSDATDGRALGRSVVTSGEKVLDEEQQEAYLREICETLSSQNGQIGEKEYEEAIIALSRMIREQTKNANYDFYGKLSSNAVRQETLPQETNPSGEISDAKARAIWEDYSTCIYLAILDAVAHPSTIIKLGALKALRDFCANQPKRLSLRPELAMMCILKAHNCEDASVVRVAEECGVTLAQNLPERVVYKLLLSVIDDENTPYQQLAGAIKMLGQVLRKISPDEEKTLLPQVVPRMMKAYDNNQSMVRRAAIICLVAISNSIGLDILKPHLNASTLKLVEVYRDRMMAR